MRFLADVNVIFPLLVSRHPDRESALEWFDTAAAGDVILCRLTRMGTLRLLCTGKVMGPDVLAPKTAMEALGVL